MDKVAKLARSFLKNLSSGTTFQSNQNARLLALGKVLLRSMKGLSMVIAWFTKKSPLGALDVIQVLKMALM
jgi:hypothetical protein